MKGLPWRITVFFYVLVHSRSCPLASPSGSKQAEEQDSESARPASSPPVQSSATTVLPIEARTPLTSTIGQPAGVTLAPPQQITVGPALSGPLLLRATTGSRARPGRRRFQLEPGRYPNRGAANAGPGTLRPAVTAFASSGS